MLQIVARQDQYDKFSHFSYTLANATYIQLTHIDVMEGWASCVRNLGYTLSYFLSSHLTTGL